MLVVSATAQNVQYRDPANPAREQWQIRTNAGAKSTVILFFDGQKNKIYEETIPGKYIKLTGCNIAKINKTFDQIAGKTMVLNQVKTDPLTSPDCHKLAAGRSKIKSRLEEESALLNRN